MQGFQRPISDGGGGQFTLIHGRQLSDGGREHYARRDARIGKFFLRINNLMLFLLGNNIQVLHISYTILLFNLSLKLSGNNR